MEVTHEALLDLFASSTAKRAQIIIQHLFRKFNQSQFNNYYHPQARTNNQDSTMENQLPMDNINLILKNIGCDDSEDGLFFKIKQNENNKIHLTKSELNRLLSLLNGAIDSGLIDITPFTSIDLSLSNSNNCRHTLNTKLCSSLIHKLANLKDVDLSNIMDVNDSFLVGLSQSIPNLEKLYIKSTPITDCGMNGFLKYLKKPQNLLELDLSNTNITNKSIELLANKLEPYNNFRKLELENIRLDLKSASKILSACSKLFKIGKGEDGAFYKFRNNVILKLPSINYRGSNLTIWHPLLCESILRNILMIHKYNPNIESIDLRSNLLSMEAVVKLINLLNFSSIQQINLNQCSHNLN